jgi:hypothetical protein
MAASEVAQLWEQAFPDKAKPALYLSEEDDEDGFRPLADPQHFITDLTVLSKIQLYATSSNNQLALKEAQDEYLSIGREIAALKGKEYTAKDPQILLNAEEFEERKEAALYGYKYEANRPALLHNGVIGAKPADDVSEQEKRDVRLFQNPFEQGGFVPTESQYKSMLAKTSNPKNMDNWAPIKKNGKELIPVRNMERPEYTTVYVRRNIDENGEVIRPTSSGTDNSNTTPSKVENKRLTRTRFGGRKVPPTRDVSEAPSAASTPGRKRAATPLIEGRDGTPASKRRRAANGNSDDRPRHPNQYTKAKEGAAQRSAKQTPNGTVTPASTATPAPSAKMPDWSTMTSEQLLARKWTDDELVHSIKHDHSWLHPDPTKAVEWRDKILNGVNPVRSWSMVKKWEEWKVTNKDKRPRKKATSAAPESIPGTGMGTATGASAAMGVGVSARVATDQQKQPASMSIPQIKMERTESEGGGVEVMRKAARTMAMNGGGAGIARSATVTPTPPRRSMRNR